MSSWTESGVWPKGIAERLRSLLLALADLATIDYHVVGVDLAIDTNRTEHESIDAHAIASRVSPPWCTNLIAVGRATASFRFRGAEAIELTPLRSCTETDRGPFPGCE
jgi:hypothetical protein